MEPDSLRLLIWSLFSVFGFLIFIFLLRNLTKSKHGSSPPLSTKPTSCITRDLNVESLRSATDDFSTLSLIKIGHSGEFFAGFLNNGTDKIVVKKGVVEDLKRELELYISLSDATCFVPLIGYCGEDKEKLFLVYEFMEGGDLATVLTSKDRPLPWIVRLKIAVEVADALLFLHCTCSPPVLHNDVQSSSILMGPNQEARLGSLSRATRVEHEELLSHDVWCYGKLLMDLISGLNVSSGDDPYSQRWLQKVMACPDRASLIGLMDPTLIMEEDLAEEIIGVVTIAKACMSQSSWITMKLVRQAIGHPARIADQGCGSQLGSSDLSHPTLIRMNGYDIESNIH
ncbi:probable LRR receptor-like serine/threonine-protein kinase At2g16250 [Magnolia sinica]|uniref:probable LRR receptor-like serine/threonine-protein kinase At2g16250 n=1 Tax=Magnolia sinica TaxID=86752 RepID=UPI0026592B3A|nr:probable LRR receptor-like serine/threonine-protein kinase At2g16250 [Magnolia sinica]